MKITDIIVAKRNKTRSNLYIDGEFFASVDNFTVIKNGLKSGMEIDKEFLNATILESEKEKALAYALDYLSKFRKTEKELKRKLYEREYSTEIVCYVLGKTKEYKFVDDCAFVNSFVDSYKHKKGERLLKYELKHKGISEEILSNFEFDKEEESSACLALCQKFFLKNEPTKENCQKLIRRLASKGFSFDDIKSSIAECKVELEME